MSQYLTSSGTITLSAVYTISSATEISVASGVALFAIHDVEPTIVNYGLVLDTNASSEAIGLAGDGAIVNAGSIIAEAPGSYGIIISESGSINNQAGGLISGNTGVFIYSGNGMISNAGTIVGTSGSGIFLKADGSVVNTGTIEEDFGGNGNPAGGAIIVDGTANIVNYGLIRSTAPENVNAGEGVEIAQGTVTNAGTIAGSSEGVAVDFIGTGSGVLILDPGQALLGMAHATGANNLVVLAAGSSAGNLANPGNYVGFATIQVDAGATWTFGSVGAPTSFSNYVQSIANEGTISIAGNVALPDGVAIDMYGNGAGSAVQLSGTDSQLPVSNFGTGDFIAPTIFGTDSSGVSIDWSGGTGATGSLTVIDNGQTFTLDNLTLAAGDTIGAPDDRFTLVSAADGVAVELVPCFAAGTRIRTTQGEIVVEQLRPGDVVCLAGGGTAAVEWLGRRRIDITRHPRKAEVLPVLIEAGALGPALPRRDLRLSPDHALLIDGVLVPAKILLNGATIRQMECASVTYYHVLLASHDVIIAEGVAAESYLDCGNRAVFENDGGTLILHPDLAQSLRETKGCAPLATHGPVVEAIRARLLARAAIPTTRDPALNIRYERGGAVIESRAVIPGHITADPRDVRCLGVKITRLYVNGHETSLDDPALCQGWHAPEPDGRWTDGSGVIPAGLLRGGRVTFETSGALPYPLRQERQPAQTKQAPPPY